MRIGIDISVLAVDRGGPANYTRNLVSALRQVYPDHQYYYYAFGSQVGEKKTVWNRIQNVVRDAFWTHSILPFKAWHDRVDILHMPAMNAPLVNKSAQVLTIFDVGILRFPGFFNYWMRTYAQMMLPRIARRVDTVITISQAAKADIVQTLRLPASRVAVIYPGIEKRFLEPCSKARLEEMRGKYALVQRFVLHVGVLSPRKNIPRLLKAYHHLKRRGQVEHQLVFVGSRGWLDADVFHTIRELNLTDEEVRFLGRVPDDELPAIYALADLVVYPSLYEGFGIPPLEAMACGTPVVASNVTSVPEVVGDAALLVDPKDELALAEAMASVLSDHSLSERLKERGAARARQFRWERTAEQTMQVYQDVLRRRRKTDGYP